MPKGTQVRQVRSLGESQKVLTNLQDVVAAGELRPFIISRIRRRELLQNLAQVKHGLFGFDNTLHSASQWPEIRRILGTEARALWETDLNQRPINGHAVTLSNKLKGRILCMSPEVQSQTEQAMLQTGWTVQLIQFMKETGVTREQIRSIAKHLPIRPGVLEIFRMMTKTSVISWGLREIVNAWLEAHGILGNFKYTSVRLLELGATDLLFDEQDRVQGCDLSSVVVNANKGTVANRFLEACGVSEGITLALGDSIYDMDMMPFLRIYQENNISGVNILILPPKVALDNLNEFETYHLERLWQRVTCLLIADDFRPLVNLFQEAHWKYDSNGQTKKHLSKEEGAGLRQKILRVTTP